MSRKKKRIVTALVLCVCVFAGVWYGMSSALCKLIEKGDTDSAIAMIDRMSAGHINTYYPPLVFDPFIGILSRYRPELPLVRACDKGNYALVKALLENGANPNKFLRDSWAPIEVVYVRGFENRYEIAELLIEYGADVNLYGDRLSAFEHEAEWLIYSPSVDEMEVYKNLKLLLDNGATMINPDEAYAGMTALHYAAWGNRTEAMRALIENYYTKVDYILEYDGSTPLMLGAREGSTEAVKVLLDYGADKSLADVDGKTAYDYAIENGHTELAELLKP